MNFPSKQGSFLVTGTDTGVGKTLVSAALIRAARAKGLEVGAMKPFESGCQRSADGQLIPTDALNLQRAAGSRAPLDRICPYRFEAALAPGVAALDSGVEVDWERIREHFYSLQELHPDGVVVEGAGGLLVPLDASGKTTLDLAHHLSLPLLVVARNSLGTLNHSALTVAAIRRSGLECLGVLLNPSAPADASSLTNRRALEELLGVQVLAELPRAQGRRMETGGFEGSGREGHRELTTISSAAVEALDLPSVLPDLELPGELVSKLFGI